MSFFMNKRNAILITAAVCLFSAFYGSYRSIMSLKNEAAAYFESSAYPLKSDVFERAGFAKNLVDRYVKYEKSNMSAEAVEIANIYESIGQPGIGAEEASRLNARLTASFDALYAKADALNMSEEDERAIVKIQADVYAKQDIIERSDYNAVAKKLNGKINSFPASFFKWAMRIGDIEIF